MPSRGQKIDERMRQVVIASNRRRRKWPEEYGCGSKLYRIWRAMKLRCYTPSHPGFKRYGGRGIGVCVEWRTSYHLFLQWALDSGYSNDLEIDRRDNDQGYGPENCRWVDRNTQARNRRDSLNPVLAFGERRAPIEWSEDRRCVVSYRLLMKRLTAGWPTELAISTPSQGRTGKRSVVMEPKYTPASLERMAEAARRARLARLANPHQRGSDGKFIS
jgi:hypothetical protein